MSDVVARSFFLAAESGDPHTMRRSLSELAPILTPGIQRFLGRQGVLVRRCRLEPDDVVQRVFERMLASPPNNPGGHEPLAVLGAWARAVALNYLLDLARRIGREASEEDSDNSETVESTSAPQQKRHETQERWQLACRCADEDLVRYKYLRELFYAIAADPDLGARDLARTIGLLPMNTPVDIQQERRAEQYVWKLRERVHVRLADWFEVFAFEAKP